MKKGLTSLFCLVILFCVSHAQNTTVPLHPTYYKNWIQTQFNRTLYLEHVNEVNLPQNHGVEYTYVGENCKLTVIKNKLNIKVQKVGEVKIYQVHIKEKKKTDSLSFKVLAYPKPVIYWGHFTNQNTDEGEIIPIQADANHVKLIMPSVLNDSYKINSWKITIDNEQFEFTNTEIPEFIHYKIFTQKSKVVACPIEVKCESKKRGELTISDTLYLANRHFIGICKTDKITIIEKNETNYGALFDMENGFSLMSLIANNSFNNVNFIVPDALKRHRNHFNYMHRYCFLGMASDEPYIDQYGNDSVSSEGNYIYPPREMLYFDIEEISHMIIIREYHSLNNTVEGIRTRLVLAKKIKGSEKLEMVLSIDFNDITSQILGTTFLPVSKNRLHLIWDENFEIVKALRECRDSIKSNKLERGSEQVNHFFQNIQYFPDFWKTKITKWQYDHYSINPSIHLLKFADQFYSQYSAPINELFEVDNIRFLEEYSCFTDYSSISTIYDLNEFGEYEELQDENGKPRMFYNPYYFYYAFSKNVNAYQVLQYNEQRDSLITKHMFFTIDYKGFEIPYLLFTLPESSDFNFIRNFNAIPLSQLPWKLELEKAHSYAKIYDPQKAADLQELDALFYLDSFDGKPLNMLNVCVGCGV